MPKPMHEQSSKVKLLTLINVSSAKPSSTTKRSRTSVHRDWHAIANQANKKPKVADNQVDTSVNTTLLADDVDGQDAVEPAASAAAAAVSSFDRHWASSTRLLDSSRTLESVSSNAAWERCKLDATRAGLGKIQQSSLRVDCEEGNEDEDDKDKDKVDFNIYATRLMDKYKEQLASASTSDHSAALSTWLLATLASYRDIFHPRITIPTHDSVRATLALHAMNHVHKTRSRVLKNNEWLAKSATSDGDREERDTRDQGFTRPKVLILAPLRSSALKWVRHLVAISQADQVENLARFEAEYALPDGAVDKLAQRREEYPDDHVDTFEGNIDDSFRLGLKVTRKSVKLFSEFYQADVIVASPLGLRTSIEKEDDADFLSSIELLVVDQMDVMTMQNWDHVQFVIDKLNTLPQEAHGADFSRIKPWYLDNKSALLRQSVLLSSYETPEMRHLFNAALHNVAGKIHTGTEVTHDGVLARVPRGVKQIFSRFEVKDVQGEDDARFEWFTTKTLPMLRKSAVSSSQTLIFVPSYFDFVRLKRYFKTLDDFSFTSISEYTPTPDVSRARGAFFAGKTNFLLVTERFHFFRRYRLRGAKTFVFYALPDHAVYYPEILSFPFAKPSSSPHAVVTDPFDVDAGVGGQDIDAAAEEVSAQVVFSRFDLLKLERVVGSEDARRMAVQSGAEASRFTFLD